MEYVYVGAEDGTRDSYFTSCYQEIVNNILFNKDYLVLEQDEYSKLIHSDKSIRLDYGSKRKDYLCHINKHKNGYVLHLSYCPIVKTPIYNGSHEYKYEESFGEAAVLFIFKNKIVFLITAHSNKKLILDNSRLQSMYLDQMGKVKRNYYYHIRSGKNALLSFIKSLNVTNKWLLDVDDIKRNNINQLKGSVEEKEIMEERRRIIQNNINEYLSGILENIKIAKSFNINIDVPTIRIPETILFSQIDDHLEIVEEFRNNQLLRLIDLSNTNFKNVKISGLDLSGTNVIIDPQEVYQKDLSNGNYDGVEFVLYSFNGVNITDSIFDNRFKANFEDAIADKPKQLIVSKKK